MVCLGPKEVQKYFKKILILIDMDSKTPKVQFTFDGCYNYERLKKEGMVTEIGRAHVRTPVTRGSRMPSSA